MSGWAGALRAARRSAVRTKGRTALVLTLIALPVAVVVAGETLARTGSVSVKESLTQTLGASDARLTFQGGEVLQLPDDSGSACTCDGSRAMTTEQVLALLPAGSRVLPVSDADASVSYPGGLMRVAAKEVDLADPVSTGLFDLRAGRFARTTSEVVVNQRVLDRGYRVGEALDLGNRKPTIVGLVEATPWFYGHGGVVVGKPGSLGADAPTRWLVDVPGGVSWQRVKDLNTKGFSVLSREVVKDPPPNSDVPYEQQDLGGSNGERTLLALVAALALVQVVLLAAPAFAVGARRQRRVLAMIGATGGAPKHVRRFVLAQGVVLGAVAGVVGTAVGIAAGVALRPALSLIDDTPGPIEVAWRDALITGGVGALAAVLAALVPALVAGRQDVLAGLTGRRGTRSRSLRTLIPGLVVLGIGITGCVSAAKPAAGTFTIVYAALPMVLGAALLAPSAIALAARSVGALPFSLRFALRDAARSRGRTAAAAAAVTATVAGAVALGIGGASDSLQGRETYQATGPRHAVVVSGFLQAGTEQQAAARAVLARRIPGVTPEVIRGVRTDDYLQLTDAGHPEGLMLSSYGGSVEGAALVGDSALDLLELPPADRAAAAAGLKATGVVALVDTPSQGPVTFTLQDQEGKTRSTRTFPSYRLVSRLKPTPAIVSEAVAAQLGTVGDSGLLYRTDLSTSQVDRLNEELSALGTGFAQVERGWTGSSDQRLAMLVLGGTAAVLVLAGTLSAALLALSDARPDFGTLMAVGAPPRVRRRVAAGYAAVIGLLGSLLGTLAGVAPGIAVSYPLTRSNEPQFASHYLDIPWTLVIGLSVVVPLTAAVGAALLTRSRLPLAGRVES